MAEDLVISYVDINVLKPAEYNPRRWSESEIANLTESIKKFGVTEPILVNSAPARHNIIIGGHFRVKIAKDLGIKTIPVVYRPITDLAAEKELNLRLNKNIGGWDYDLLKLYDENMLRLSGFSDEEISDIMNASITDLELKNAFDIEYNRNFVINCETDEEFAEVKKLLNTDGNKIQAVTFINQWQKH